MTIDPLKIKEQLDFDCDVELLESVDSTNLYLKRKSDTDRNALVVAKKQTAGRGRLGKNFYSDENGIYMSFLFKKTIDPNDVYLLTVTAAVAVCEALNDLFKINTKIKWVNDIYFENKKLCGILCETAIGKETKIEKSIIGIGINVENTSFPPDISDIATSLSQILPQGTHFDKSRIISSIINRFYDIINYLSPQEIVCRYKRSSLMYGKTVTVFSQENQYTAIVTDIDDKAQLVVKKCSGEIITLNSGEVSIKL